MTEEFEQPPSPGVSIETRYQAQKEILVGMLERQFDYGKWVLASLLAVHGGSLLAISQAGESRDKLFAQCGSLLIWGLVAAVFSGGLAWINFSFSSVMHFNSLVGIGNNKPYEPSWSILTVVRGTYAIAPAIAAISMCLFLWAAFEAQSALKVEKKTYWYQTPGATP